jgi:hypothetical protein
VGKCEVICGHLGPWVHLKTIVTLHGALWVSLADAALAGLIRPKNTAAMTCYLPADA